MKFKFRKCVAVMVVGFLLVNMTPVYAKDSNKTNYDVSKEIKMRLSEISATIASAMNETVLAEAPAKEQYSNLLNKLEKSLYSNTRDMECGLKQYYGGAYLNDDNKLTICCTSNDAQIVDAFKNAAGSSDVVISYVMYTLDELYTMKDQFTELLLAYKNDDKLNSESKNLVSDIEEYGIDIFNNQFTICINELNLDKETLFYELFDMFPEKSVRIEEAHKTTTTVQIKPGGQLYLSASSSASGVDINQSVGYRGFRLDALGSIIYGFTTCGHSQATYLYKGGEKVGTLYDYRNGGNYDISFYDAESGITLSNITSYSDDAGSDNEVVELSLDSVPSNNILIGSTLMKVGGTSFYTQGQILDTACTWGNGTYTNAIKTRAINLAGDSGGAAFIYYNGKYIIVGTMSGSRYNGGILTSTTFECSYVAQYKYAYNALNSVIYRY